jgi:CRISPR-associated protein (TIGR03984 family)
MSQVQGCEIEQLDAQRCKAWIDHVLGEGPQPLPIQSPAWVLLHCDDGVTWGRLDGARWRLGSEVFPDLCPRLSDISIQELRVFCREFEVLVWRKQDGYRGRVLRDVERSSLSGPVAPDEEKRPLLGDRVIEHRDGFTRVGDGTGAEQVLPLRLPERPMSTRPLLVLRHYFGRDEQTGCVRVAASRLVEVK